MMRRYSLDAFFLWDRSVDGTAGVYNLSTQSLFLCVCVLAVYPVLCAALLSLRSKTE
jgi:hypothetical protein